ncbi:MAG: hypothetical protein LBB77_00705 [Treponema sp.]|jgi:hypothetical protein|nr:hypothetical protein [Treponema sp.]
MGKKPNRTFAIVLLCVFSACLNALAMLVFRLVLETPLYFDTVFTAMAAFCWGLWPGILTGLLTNFIINTVWFAGWGGYLFGICNGIVALVTVLFVRLCPDELDLEREDLSLGSKRLYGVLYRVMALFLLAFALTAALSISGGFIAFCIKAFIPGSAGITGPEEFYALPLVGRTLSILLVEILSRIPVNVPDRLLTAFCGYALARGLKAAARRRRKYARNGLAQKTGWLNLSKNADF